MLWSEIAGPFDKVSPRPEPGRYVDLEHYGLLCLPPPLWSSRRPGGGP